MRSCLEEMEQARLGEADRELEDDRAAEDKDRAEGGRCGAEQAPAASASAQLAARGQHTKLGLRAAM